MAVSSRYENALTYRPGRSVGFYPELPLVPRNDTPTTLPPTPPAQFDTPAVAPPPETGVSTAGSSSGGGSNLLNRVGPMALSAAIKQGGNALKDALKPNQPGVDGTATAFSTSALDSSLTPAQADALIFGQNGGSENLIMTPGGENTGWAVEAGTSAAPIDAAADFGGAIDTAMGQAAIGTAGESAAAAGGAAAEGAAGGALGGAAGFVGGMIPGIIGAGFGRALTGMLGDDWETNPYISSAGTAIGGMIGSIGGPLGTIAGAAIGNFLANAAFGEEADRPYSFTGGTVQIGPDGQPMVSLGGVRELNGGSTEKAQTINDVLASYLAGRAAEDGLVANPNAVGRTGFYAGLSDRGLFYQPFTTNEWLSSVEPTNQIPVQGRDYVLGGSPDLYLPYIYNDLVSRGFYTPQGSAPSWSDVEAQRNGALDQLRGTTTLMDAGSEAVGSTYFNSYADPFLRWTVDQYAQTGQWGTRDQYANSFDTSGDTGANSLGG